MLSIIIDLNPLFDTQSNISNFQFFKHFFRKKKKIPAPLQTTLARRHVETCLSPPGKKVEDLCTVLLIVRTLERLNGHLKSTSHCG